VLKPSSTLKFTSLRAHARPRANASCADAGGSPLQVTLHARDPYKGSLRSTPFTCTVNWSTSSLWQICSDLHTSSSSSGYAHYVEFSTPRGDCWEISGATVLYEP
jgi:hypothetical protein